MAPAKSAKAAAPKSAYLKLCGATDISFNPYTFYSSEPPDRDNPMSYTVPYHLVVHTSFPYLPLHLQLAPDTDIDLSKRHEGQAGEEGGAAGRALALLAQAALLGVLPPTEDAAPAARAEVSAEERSPCAADGPVQDDCQVGCRV